MAKKVRIVRPEGMAIVEENKQDLLTKLSDARQRLLDKVSSLSPAQQGRIYLGEWSVRDLLAHLIGWDNTYVAAVQDLMAGELPSFYSAYDEDWKSYNYNLVQEYSTEDWAELLAAIRESHAKLMSLLESVPDDDFIHDWGVRYDGTIVTIARLLKAEIKDEHEHLNQLRSSFA